MRATIEVLMYTKKRYSKHAKRGTDSTSFGSSIFRHNGRDARYDRDINVHQKEVQIVPLFGSSIF